MESVEGAWPMRTTVSLREPDSPAPPHAGGGGGGGKDWKFLTTAQNLVVGHLIKGRLAEEGIESLLDTSNPAPGAFLKPFGDQMAPVQVFVREIDYEKASFVLYEVDHSPPAPTAKGSRTTRLMWTFMIALILLVAILRILEMTGFTSCILRPFCF
jgi:hypothetical protein